MNNASFETTKTLEFVSDFLGFDLTQKCRKRYIVEGRMMYTKLMKRYTNVSLSDIGRAIGKDHATVIHYINNFAHLKKTDQQFACKFDMMADTYEEFRETWFDNVKFDDKRKIKVLESSLKELLDKKMNTNDTSIRLSALTQLFSSLSRGHQKEKRSTSNQRLIECLTP